MASEKCTIPKNVEPFGNPNGDKTNTNEQWIRVYSGGSLIKNSKGILEVVSTNHMRIIEGDEVYDIYNATIIACDYVLKNRIRHD